MSNLDEEFSFRVEENGDGTFAVSSHEGSGLARISLDEVRAFMRDQVESWCDDLDNQRGPDDDWGLDDDRGPNDEAEESNASA